MNESDIARLGAKAQQQLKDKLGTTKKSKYRNCPDSRGALRFDSRKEERWYDELSILQGLERSDIRLLRREWHTSWLSPRGSCRC